MPDTSTVQTPRIARGVMRRSLKLLEMEYTPAELADELGVSPKTIYTSYLPAGLPFRKDGTGHVWIIGTSARAWLEGATQHSVEKPVPPLGKDDAFCVKCRQVVTMDKISRRRFGRAGIMSGICPKCGREARRFIKLAELEEAQPKAPGKPRTKK